MVIDSVYDPKGHSLYFELREGVVSHSAEFVNHRVIFDFNEDNELLSVEFVLVGMLPKIIVDSEETTPILALQTL